MFKSDQSVPKQVAALSSMRIVAVSVGEFHMAAISGASLLSTRADASAEDGSLYCWGRHSRKVHALLTRKGMARTAGNCLEEVSCPNEN